MLARECRNHFQTQRFGHGSMDGHCSDGRGFSILPRNSPCSIMIFWFRFGFRCLFPWGLLLPHFFSGKGFWSIMISCFLLGFWGSVPSLIFPGLSWFGLGVWGRLVPFLFSFLKSLHDLLFPLVLARVPVFVPFFLSGVFPKEKSSAPS